MKMILRLMLLITLMFSALAVTAQTYTTTSDARCGTTASLTLTCFETFNGQIVNFIGFTRSTPAGAYANQSVMYAEEFTPEFQGPFAPIVDSFTFDSPSGIYELRYHDPAGLTEVDMKFAYLAQSYGCGRGSICHGHFWNILTGSTYTINAGPTASPAAADGDFNPSTNVPEVPFSIQSLTGGRKAIPDSPIAPTPTCIPEDGAKGCPKDPW